MQDRDVMRPKYTSLWDRLFYSVNIHAVPNGSFGELILCNQASYSMDMWWHKKHSKLQAFIMFEGYVV